MADIDALIGKLKTGDYYSRSTAARALGEMGGEKATAALIEALKDEDDWVKEYAAEALGKLASRQAVKPLGELLKCDSYKVQSAAAEALGEIGGDEARALLEPLKNHDDSWVREAVVNALKRISSGQSRPGGAEPDEAAVSPTRGSRTVPATSRTADGSRVVPATKITEMDSVPILTMNEAPAQPARRRVTPSPRLSDRAPRTPEEIVRLITEGTSISYRATHSGFLLRVPVGEGRRQKVRLKFDSIDEDGSLVIQLFTLIAPARPEHYHWALRLNPTFSYGALGIVRVDDKEFLAITNTLLEENVDPKALEKCVWTLARKGDALEKKLIQKDVW